MRGFRHICKLVDCNKELSLLRNDIKFMERSRRHLVELSKELVDLRLQLQALHEQWDDSYADADTIRRQLTIEYNFAIEHPHAYYDCLLDELVRMDSEASRIDTKDDTKEEMDKKRANVLLTVASIDVSCRLKTREKSQSLHSRRGNGASSSHNRRAASPTSSQSLTLYTMDTRNTASSMVSTSQSGDTIPTTVSTLSENPVSVGKDGEYNKHHSLSTTVVKARCQQLTELRAIYKTEMPSVGAKTCQFTVETKQVQTEIARMGKRMACTPENLYTDIQAQVLRHRIYTALQAYNFLHGTV